MAEKILQTRILNKVDTLEAWNSSSLKLKKGELAFATVAASAGTGLSEPVVMVKIGTEEEKTFAELPWAFHAKASDVLAACKTEAALTAFVNGVIANAGIATNSAMQELAGKVTTAEGKITALEGTVGDATKGLVKGVADNAAAITALQGLVGDTKVATQIDNAIAALKLGETYAAKALETTVDNHVKDTVAHVTADDKTKWNAALQVADIAAGTANGTIKVRGTDIAVTGLGSAAYTASTAYDVAGAADDALATAKTYAEEKAAAAESAAKSHAETKASAAESAAKTYAEQKASAAQTAAQGYADTAAADALADAKEYVNEVTGGKTVSESINATIANYSTTAQMNEAIAAAKGEAVKHANDLNTAMDERVDALEADTHTHSFVESELNLIKAGDVAKWNAAEQNAKDYADGLNTAMDSRVDALEAKFTGEDSVADQIADAVAVETEAREQAIAGLQSQIGEASAEGKAATGLHADIEALETLVGDESVATQISNAVAAEAEIARAAEKANADAIKAISDDYLKAADKTELEGKIKSNADAIALLTNGVDEEVVDGVNDLIAYVAEHGTEVTGMKKDISDNADAIRELDKTVAVISGDYLTSADEAALQGEIAKKAAQADLEALQGRVTTAEGKITTAEGKITGLEGDMSAAESAIEALQTKVGDKTVAEQIEAAVEEAKTDASNKDAVVLAEVTAAVKQHNTDKAALEAAIAKKANDADLAAIAKTGSTDDLVQGELVLVFDCGGAGV